MYVETTHNVLDQQDGPAILVGRSYGGVVITEAGMHDKVAGLVYIAAFAPDAGESVTELAAFMADSQVPWGLEALNGAVSEPAWRSKPSWYLVASDERMIPPPAQRAMSERAGATVVEAPGSHSIYVSQPQATADLMAQTAQQARAETAQAV